MIDRNPLQSKFIEIGGRDTISHQALPKEKMQQIRIEAITLPKKERLMVSLLSYTGMRFEEVLGIRWDDINEDWINIQRAVIHPQRNKPLIKPPKTKTSNRIVPYKQYLKDLTKQPGTKPDDFPFCHQAKNEKIGDLILFPEKRSRRICNSCGTF